MVSIQNRLKHDNIQTLFRPSKWFKLRIAPPSVPLGGHSQGWGCCVVLFQDAWKPPRILNPWRFRKKRIRCLSCFSAGVLRNKRDAWNSQKDKQPRDPRPKPSGFAPSFAALVAFTYLNPEGFYVGFGQPGWRNINSPTTLKPCGINSTALKFRRVYAEIYFRAFHRRNPFYTL